MVAKKQYTVLNAQLVSESVVDSDYWVASISGDPAVNCALDDYAEFVVSCCGVGDVYQVQAVQRRVSEDCANEDVGQGGSFWRRFV